MFPAEEVKSKRAWESRLSLSQRHPFIYRRVSIDRRPAQIVMSRRIPIAKQLSAFFVSFMARKNGQTFR